MPYLQSPTKELMDRHHDTDALTAYKSQIKVYQPEAAENPDTINTINEEDEGEFNEYDLVVAAEKS